MNTPDISSRPPLNMPLPAGEGGDAISVLAAEIAESDLPRRMANAELLLGYGAVRRPADTLEAWHSVMEAHASTRLIACLKEVLSLMRQAEPVRRSWLGGALARFDGRALEDELKRELALKDLEVALAESSQAAEGVSAYICRLDGLREENSKDRVSLAAHLKAGTAYLSDASTADLDEGATDNLARLRRKLQELTNVLASAEILQLELARARSTAMDLLERHTHTQTALVPIWRQHGGRAFATVAARMKLEHGISGDGSYLTSLDKQ